MKKIKIISKAGLMCLWVLLLVYETSQAQDPYTGMWEGDFMEQFKTVILLDQVDDGKYAGKILMYSGENRIQDDELTKISISDRSISFFIAAKETSFLGSFNETNTAFSGNFVFPDNSRHPLTVRNYEKDSLAVKKEAPSLKEKLKESIPAEDLKSDFRKLINKLKEYHPRLYSHTPEASFRTKAEEILQGLDTKLGMEEFYARIAPLVASVQCSHTGIRLPHAYQQALHDESSYFPLKVYIADLKAYYLSAPGNPGVKLVPGCEIKTINGRPADQIIRELMDLIPSEGGNQTRKYQELNRDFQTYFHLLDPAERFTVDFSLPNSEDSIKLDAIPYSGIQQREAQELSAQPYDFHMQNNPAGAILKISSFGIRDMEGYFAFLDSTFLQLKESEIQDLILDLRDNQGGHPIFAAQLLSYLCSNEFTWFKRNPDVEEFEPLYNPMQPNSPHYSGRLYVLINGNCLSTTGHLISLLKYHTGAIFVGEEPGSSFLCNDYSIQIRLPNTGMEVNIPRTTFMTAVKGFKDGDKFPLDHEIRISVQDVLADTDTYTSFVYELIDKEWKQSAGQISRK